MYGMTDWSNITTKQLLSVGLAQARPNNYTPAYVHKNHLPQFQIYYTNFTIYINL